MRNRIVTMRATRRVSAIVGFLMLECCVMLALLGILVIFVSQHMLHNMRAAQELFYQAVAHNAADNALQTGAAGANNPVLLPNIFYNKTAEISLSFHLHYSCQASACRAEATWLSLYSKQAHTVMLERAGLFN